MPELVPVRNRDVPEKNRRQEQSLLQECSIYRPIQIEAGALHRVYDSRYDSIPFMQRVPCQFHSTGETVSPGIMGRTKAINILSMDTFFMAWDIPIYDTYGILILDPDLLNSAEIAQEATFFVVHGNPKVRDTKDDRRPYGPRTNMQEVYVKRLPIPKEIQDELLASGLG